MKEMDDLSDSDSSGARMAAVILAAGMGTRMRSGLPKVLHRAAGDPLVVHVVEAARVAGVSDIVVVVGHGRDLVMSALGDSVRYAVQEPQLGTGHALSSAIETLDPVPSHLIVLCGDAPLVRPETIARLAAEGRDAAVVVLSANLPEPRGYGRIVRGSDGSVRAIVEEADATEAERAISEINSGIYRLDGSWVAANLSKIEKSRKGEYYLTDLVALAVREGRNVRALVASEAAEVLGVNDRFQLAEADRVLRYRHCARLMDAGVTVVDPSSTFVERSVSVGQDSTIYPGTHLRGRTTVGARCEIGPNAILEDATVGDDCRIVASMLEQCVVDDRVAVGPFSHLRPGAVIKAGARIGNYAEVKNSTVGEGVQMHHFSYLGDAEVGSGTNVGAGTITCNFDGRTRKKYRTKIGKGVFLGSDTLLRAPVELGDGAQTGAGAVVTKNVPAGSLAVGVPARIRQLRGAETEQAETKLDGGVEGSGS
ncbi:MAG TPA: bifunctional UDP-N-acetylglucosamine diphosphorylase/glucosamine-1-phosphate N-acetyltransferase GlmU [Chloroflexota bacterium]